MKINNIQITKDDFENLAETIATIREYIAEDKIEIADNILSGLETHLKRNLREDKEMNFKHMRSNNVRFTSDELRRARARRLNFEDEIDMDERIAEYQENKHYERQLEIEKGNALRGDW